MFRMPGQQRACYPARTIRTRIPRSSMKFSSLACAACTSAPLLLALVLPADELAFRPAANSEASKTLKIDAEFNVTSASAMVDGQPLPGEMLDELKSKSLILNMLVGVTEKY